MSNMFFAIKLAIFLLLVVDLHGTLGRWQGQQRQNYFNIANSDEEIPTNPDYGAQLDRSVIQNWGGGFRPPYVVKRTKQPLTEDVDYMVENDKFLFPDQVSAPLTSVGTRIDTPPDCADTFSGMTFCEDVPNYPLHSVNLAVKNSKKIQSYENVDAIDNISVRIETNTLDLCEFDSRIVKPRLAENRRKEWMYIINTKNVTQGVRVEICKEAENSCKLIDGFAAGYTTFCKQMYTYRQLLAYSSDGSVINDSFQFPTSCCCQVQQVDVLTRLRTSRSAQSRRYSVNAN